MTSKTDVHSLRVLLVDDERLARSRMRRLLSAHTRSTGSTPLRVVAEAGSVTEAAEALRAAENQGKAIDVVFLDVQMPGSSGFVLFDIYEVKAQVIFVTAFGEHALRAFEVNALDYLVKPVSPERLQRCLSRLNYTKAPSGVLVEEDKVHIESDGVQRFVSLRDILGVRAAGDYTEVLIADGSTPWTRLSLAAWESRLGSTKYMRVHRGAIVRLESIVSARRGAEGFVVEVGRHVLPVSRRSAPELRRWLREFHGRLD